MGFSQTQSDRAIFLEIVLGKKIIPVFDYVNDVSMEWGLNTDFSVQIKYFDESMVTIEQAILDAVAMDDRKCKVKFGWLDGPQATVNSFITDYRPDFSPTGTNIEMSSKLALQQDLEKVDASWPKDTKPSDIAQEIAQKYGWKAEIEDAKPRKAPILAKGVNLVTWLRNEFCTVDGKGCESAAGNPGPYQVSVNPITNTLHFHTAGYKKGETKRKYTFGRGRGGQVLAFRPHDTTMFSAAIGTGAVISRCYDPKEKKIVEKKLAYADRPGYETPALDKSGGGFLPKLPSDKSLPTQMIRTALRTKEEQDARSTTIFDYFARLMYTAELSILGDPEIELNDIIQVEMLTPDNEPHYLSGVYCVQTIKHQLGEGGFVTDLAMSRETALSGTTGVNGRARPAQTRVLPDAPGVVREIPQ